VVLVRICWYVCGLFLLACFGLSAMTVIPEEAARTKDIVALVLAGMSLVSGLTALALTRAYKRHPKSAIFKSKRFERVCIGLAVVLTLVVLLGVFG
jgi:uncharacterized BrkB/YihY/UPF0761 family membrane protein